MCPSSPKWNTILDERKRKADEDASCSATLQASTDRLVLLNARRESGVRLDAMGSDKV
jgi:hypothetical protein